MNRNVEHAITLLVIFFTVLIIMLIFGVKARSTEYLLIDRDDVVYCDNYAKRSEQTVADIVQAYGDCIRVLPERLPMPVLQGSVPAGDRPVEQNGNPGSSGPEWEAACAAEYRTWDADTGTVIRRGSPERVRCPCGGEVACGE